MAEIYNNILYHYLMIRPTLVCRAVSQHLGASFPAHFPLEDKVVRNVITGLIDTRTARAKLAVRKEPFWITLATGEALGYFRPQNGGAGTWFARFYDSRTRKKMKKSLGTADDFADADDRDVFTCAQAQKKAREWFEEMRSTARGEVHRKGPLTVAQAWEAYEDYSERRGKKGLPATRQLVEAHILPALGKTEVIELTQWVIERWHSALAKAPARVRSKKGQEPAFKAAPTTDYEKRARRATANRILAVLKAILSFAKHRGLTRVSSDAWREVKPFEGVVAARQRFLTPEEAQRLVNVCPPDFKRLVQGALYTGARFGELSRLVVSDFNPSEGKVTIGPSKNNPHPRHAVLQAEGQEFFKDLTAGRRGDQPMFLRESFANRNSKSAKVIRTWRKSEPARCMIEACEASGLESLTFHELRHTHASGLVNNGVPLAFVAAQLGHLDTRMVEKHYGHLAPSAMADAIRALAPKLGIFKESKVETLTIKKDSTA